MLSSENPPLKLWSACLLNALSISYYTLVEKVFIVLIWLTVISIGLLSTMCPWVQPLPKQVLIIDLLFSIKTIVLNVFTNFLYFLVFWFQVIKILEFCLALDVGAGVGLIIRFFKLFIFLFNHLKSDSLTWEPLDYIIAKYYPHVHQTIDHKACSEGYDCNLIFWKFNFEIRLT